jgi:enoyl-CoA hydratase/carnithine racemase
MGMKLDYTNLVCETFGPVLRMTINRPERLNALSHGPQSVHADLNEALQEADIDDNVRCIVVTGQGRAFSSGGDMGGENPTLESLTQWQGGRRQNAWDNYIFHEEEDGDMELVHNLHKPVIAMINGLCYGAGLIFAAHCDLLIASDQAKFSLIESRMGASGVDVFPYLVGPQWAKFLMISGEIISAQRAQQIGLVLEVIPHQELWERTLDLASRISAMPRFGVMLNKRNIDGTLDMMGWSSNKRFSRSHKALIEAMADRAQATDGRLLRAIISEEGFQAFKEARDQPFREPWLRDEDI